MWPAWASILVDGAESTHMASTVHVAVLQSTLWARNKLRIHVCVCVWVCVCVCSFAGMCTMVHLVKKVRALVHCLGSSVTLVSDHVRNWICKPIPPCLKRFRIYFFIVLRCPYTWNENILFCFCFGLCWIVFLARLEIHSPKTHVCYSVRCGATEHACVTVVP